MRAAATDIVCARVSTNTYGSPRCTQGNDYPLHDAVKNNASEALVMALLGTRPNEAKRLDGVRLLGAHPSHTRRHALPFAPPSTPREHHILVRSFAL